jgi:hypothetical protein
MVMLSLSSSAFASMFIDEFNSVIKLTPEVSKRQPESKSEVLGTGLTEISVDADCFNK